MSVNSKLPVLFHEPHSNKIVLNLNHLPETKLISSKINVIFKRCSILFSSSTLTRRRS